MPYRASNKTFLKRLYQFLLFTKIVDQQYKNGFPKLRFYKIYIKNAIKLWKARKTKRFIHRGREGGGYVWEVKTTEDVLQIYAFLLLTY